MNNEDNLYSPRQQRIALHLDKGLTRAQMAVAEVCSLNTIKTQMSRMYSKAGVNNKIAFLNSYFKRE